jgi:multidrug efflux system outer membrane protein
MKLSNSYIIIFSILISLILTNCKVPKTVQQPALKKIPETFNKEKDTSNSAYVNWKLYFTNRTLTELIDTALGGNLDLLMSLQKIEIARSNVKYSKGLALPYVWGNVSVGQRRFGKYTMDAVGNYDVQFSPHISKDEIIPEHLPDHYLGLQTSWEADIWGKLRNKKRAAIARYLATVEGRNWVITNLISEIAITYYELLALDNELDIIKETVILQNNQLSFIQLQKDAGRANELAVKQFEAQVLNSRGLEIEAMQKIIECENKLNFLLGRFPQPIKRDKSSFSQSMPTNIQTGIPSDLLSNRPDVKQAEYEMVSSKANTKAAKAAFYPSLNIAGAAGLQSFNPKFIFSPESFAYNIMGGLTAPLLNTSAIKAQYRTANALQIEAIYNYQKTIINGYVEVYNQINNINNLEQIHKLKTQEVDVLTTAIETSSELYSTGRAGYLEIIITRQNALLSKLELIEIKQRQYNSVINIYKALGGGWK